MGSCFVDSIGNRLLQNKFHCLLNPFGTLYSPASIFQMLYLLQGTADNLDDWNFHSEGIFGNWLFATDFMSESFETVKQKTHSAFLSAKSFLEESEVIFLTFGTTHYYMVKNPGQKLVVSNCLKQPARLFEEHIPSLDEVVELGTAFFRSILEQKPNLNIVLTVSPYRYMKYGLHENNLSKSVLLLACSKWQELFSENILYFPSFEIVQDELRDYRFYAEDMLHPSPVAVDYIWQQLQDNWMTKATQDFIRDWEPLCKALKHQLKGVHPEKEKLFLQKTLANLVYLREKYPNLALENEIGALRREIDRINKFEI